MTLKPQELAELSTKKKNSGFTPEQLEILEEEHNKRIANEEIKDQEYEDNVDYYRKKYGVSKQDALEIIARNN